MKAIVECVTGLSSTTSFHSIDLSCRGRTIYSLPLPLPWSHARCRQHFSHHGASFGRLFDVLIGNDVVGDVHACYQRPFSHSHGASLLERHGTPEQISEQTTQQLSPLHSSNNEVGLRNSRMSYNVESEASLSPDLVPMVRDARCRPLHRSRSFQTPCKTKASTGRGRDVSTPLDRARPVSEQSSTGVRDCRRRRATAGR